MNNKRYSGLTDKSLNISSQLVQIGITDKDVKSRYRSGEDSIQKGPPPFCYGLWRNDDGTKIGTS